VVASSTSVAPSYLQAMTEACAKSFNTSTFTRPSISAPINQTFTGRYFAKRNPLCKKRLDAKTVVFTTCKVAVSPTSRSIVGCPMGFHGTGSRLLFRISRGVPSRPNKSRLLKPPFLHVLTCFYALFTRLLLFLINKRLIEYKKLFNLS
jgi:hypothetical protein